jgi:hypothetical protein
MQRFTIHGLSFVSRLGNRRDAFGRHVHKVDANAGMRRADDMTEGRSSKITWHEVQIVSLCSPLAFEFLSV